MIPAPSSKILRVKLQGNHRLGNFNVRDDFILSYLISQISHFGDMSRDASLPIPLTGEQYGVEFGWPEENDWGLIPISIFTSRLDSTTQKHILIGILMLYSSTSRRYHRVCG